MRSFTDTLAALFQKTEGHAAHCFRIEMPEFGLVWRYTNHPAPLALGAETFAPEVIKLAGGKERDDGGAAPKEFIVETAPLEPFITFTTHRFGGTVNVTVLECFYDETTSQWHGDIVAEGQVVGQIRRLASLRIECRGLASWVKKKVPALLYSRYDQRMLYGAGFGADVEDFKQADCEIIAVNLNIVRSVQAGYAADGSPLTPWDIEGAGTVALNFASYRHLEVHIKANKLWLHDMERKSHLIGELRVNGAVWTPTWTEGFLYDKTENLTISPGQLTSGLVGVSLKIFSSAGTVRFKQRPRATNQYTTILELVRKKPDNGSINCELTWYNRLEAVSRDNDYYKGGYIAYQRTITGVDGVSLPVTFRVPIVNNIIDPVDENNNAFVLLYPPPYLQEGDTFDAYAGYDGTAAMADLKFNTFHHNPSNSADWGFLGFPHIPINNPTLNSSALECR